MIFVGGHGSVTRTVFKPLQVTGQPYTKTREVVLSHRMALDVGGEAVPRLRPAIARMIANPM